MLTSISAKRNRVLPGDLTDGERQLAHKGASHRYRVYWEALQLSRLSRIGNKLVAMYLDGQQHHIRQFAALHLRSVGKQQGTQSWQGDGGLIDNCAGQLIPSGFTAKRRQELSCQRLHLLPVLPLAGFDSILVASSQVTSDSRRGSGILSQI